MRPFNHTLPLCLSLLVSATVPAAEVVTDLLAAGADAWRAPLAPNWIIEPGRIAGCTERFDGDKADPAASAFLVSRQTFGGDLTVDLDVTFERGRYLGVYVDFSQETGSGIWMATGHPLAEDAPGNEIERAYIKTVDKGFWVVRTNGELPVRPGKMIRLRIERRGDDYSLWNDGRLIVTYHKPGGYPAGPLQLRLTNAAAEIHRLEVRSARVGPPG